MSVLTGIANGQAPKVLHISPVQTYAGVVDFTVDNLGNIYLVNALNQIKKVSEKGDSLAVYNDVRRYGQVHTVDATNPLKVLVHYKDFGTIIILDRLLNVRNRIDLRKQNLLQVKSIATSYDNNIWLYDELDGKFKKIDETGKVLMESVDLRQVLDAAPAPTIMYDRDGQLYMYDEKKGLFVFDYYGAQKNKYSLLKLKDIQVIEKNKITGRDSSYIFLFKPHTLQYLQFHPIENWADVRKLRFTGNRIYALYANGILKVFKAEE